MNLSAGGEAPDRPRCEPTKPIGGPDSFEPVRPNAQHCQAIMVEPVALLRTIMQTLDASGCSYALIQGDRSLEEALTSDVDIAFGENPNEVMLPIIRQLAETSGARLIQCLHYEIPHGYYYVLAVGTPSRFLHLDCLYDPLGVNRYRLPTPFLLEGVVAGPWAKRASKERVALYLLMKRAVKGNASPEALELLRGCFSGASDALWSDVRGWFGDRARPLVAQLLEPRTAGEIHSLLARLRAAAETRFRFKHPARYVLSLAMGLVRKARRFVQPTGLFVVVLGPDGVGKSMVAGLVVSQLARAFRRTWRFHWRPGLLPKLSRGKPSDEPNGGASVPPDSSRYRGIVSLARFGYYWLDFVAGYWLRIYLRKAQTTLVIGERYFPDVLVSPARYGFSVPRWLMRLARRCVPSPDLVVLLTDEPEVIRARKAELSISAIAAQLVAYRNEIRHWCPAATITTTGGAEAVAGRISDLILDARAHRTAHRLERHPLARWRGFPSAAQARLWVGDCDTLPNALKLYHPYSRLGRWAKAVIGVLSPTASRAWPGARPDRQTGERLDRLAHLIRKALGGEKLGVSFWTGTPGPRRRLTAQVSRGDAVLSYVKIANREADSKLLQHEADMMAWMESRLADAAVLPRTLAFHAVDGRCLLLLSAPTRPWKQRPLQPDHNDARFLSALASFSDEKLTAAQIFEAMGFSALIARVAQSNPSAADILRAAMDAVCSGFGQKRIGTAPCHGDFAPWNTLELADGRLYVFDWEHASKEAPLCTDLFHRVFMPARLVLSQTPHAVVCRLLALYDDPVLGPVIKQSRIERGELPGYLLIYLIGMAMREETDGGKASNFLSDALEHALQAFVYPGRRANVLVAAYACEPGGGSEPGVGWNMCQAISREHNAWVITRRNNRERIERALALAPNPHLHFDYADLPRWARFWKKGRRGIRTYYYLWQFAACLKAWRVTRRIRFDLAHHVTFVNSYVFSFLGLLPLPFVWGPLGSNPKLPTALASSQRVVLRDRLRYVWQQFLRVADPLFWLCTYRARLIIGIDASIGRQLPIAVLGKRKFVVHTAIGVEGELAEAQPPPQATGLAIRVLSIGQMIPIKGFHLALRAFAALLQKESEARLEIVGDGPERQALQRLATRLGIAESVKFVGWLPREQALSTFGHADIFLFPSCEGAGMVILEAMAHGLPVVCLDFGGPGEMVTSECGFAVEVGDTETTVAALGAALVTLAKDPSLRLRMAKAARRRVEEYSWAARRKVIGQWYAKALSTGRSMRSRVEQG